MSEIREWLDYIMRCTTRALTVPAEMLGPHREEHMKEKIEVGDFGLCHRLPSPPARDAYLSPILIAPWWRKLRAPFNSVWLPSLMRYTSVACVRGVLAMHDASGSRGSKQSRIVMECVIDHGDVPRNVVERAKQQARSPSELWD